MNVGDIVPEPYYSRIYDRSVGRIYIRRCIICKYKWPVVEIPLFGNHPEQTMADCCPIHSDIRSKVIDTRTPDNYMRSGVIKSRSISICYQLNGIYRRRQCRVEDCWEEKRNYPKRWSTVELMADSLIVENPARCTRCNGRGMLLRDDQSPEVRDRWCGDRPSSKAKPLTKTEWCWRCGKHETRCKCLVPIKRRPQHWAIEAADLRRLNEEE